MADAEISSQGAKTLGPGESANGRLLFRSQLASTDAIPSARRRVTPRWPPKVPSEGSSAGRGTECDNGLSGEDRRRGTDPRRFRHLNFDTVAV